MKSAGKAGNVPSLFDLIYLENKVTINGVLAVILAIAQTFSPPIPSPFHGSETSTTDGWTDSRTVDHAACVAPL